LISPFVLLRKKVIFARYWIIIHVYIMRTSLLFASVVSVAMAAASCSNNEGEVLAVRLDQKKIELVKGESLQLNAQVVPDQDAEFIWYSQDENYVTVDQNGLVTAVGLYKKDPSSDEVSPVSVYVKYQNGADECLVTVLPLAPSKVEIIAEGNSVKVNPMESVQLEAKCYPEDADLVDITWSTDYAAVAVVDSKTGIVTGVAPGFARIKASYNDKVYDEIDVQVNTVEPTAVAVNPSSLSLSYGQKVRLKAELTPSNATGKQVWTSTDTSVATVDSETGTVTGAGVGTADIKVQVGKVSATCRVTVSK
jgi:uncharacterized protein YjdB